MVASLLNGGAPIFLSGGKDDDGNREYTVARLVRTSSIYDGPATVMACPGLPTPGSAYNIGTDIDVWAFCKPNMKVTIHQQLKEGEPTLIWRVEQQYTTKPGKRCRDTSIEDPLLEPQKVSGSFIKKTKEVTQDRHGNTIKSSSHEIIRGPQVEFDSNNPTVRIEQNVASLGLSTFAQMVDTVNNNTLWGLSSRKIKLSNVTWERKLYGVCNYYYTRSFDFDIDYNGFDKYPIDEGTKVLNGHWGDGTGTGSVSGWILDDVDGGAPDPSNPSHFIRFKDRHDENAHVILNGAGLPLEDGDNPVPITVEYYRESNFLLLGIPTVF